MGYYLKIMRSIMRQNYAQWKHMNGPERTTEYNDVDGRKFGF